MISARSVLLFFCLWSSVVGTVWADVTSDTLSEITRCSTIEDSIERLRCFDRAAPRAREALVPRPEDFGKPPAPRAPEVPQLTAAVRQLSKTSRGRAVFLLDNGQTWRQIDGDDAQVPDVEPGDSPLRVTIVKGVFGGYNLTIDGRNALVRVRRVE